MRSPEMIHVDLSGAAGTTTTRRSGSISRILVLHVSRHSHWEGAGPSAEPTLPMGADVAQVCSGLARLSDWPLPAGSAYSPVPHPGMTDQKNWLCVAPNGNETQRGSWPCRLLWDLDRQKANYPGPGPTAQEFTDGGDERATGTGIPG